MSAERDELLAVIAQLRDELATLNRRVARLEQRAEPGSAQPDAHTMLVIAAAVAAFLGVRAQVRQVRLVHSSAWAQVGRIGVHASHRLN